MHRPTAMATALLAVTALLTGCSVSDPYAAPARTAATHPAPPRAAAPEPAVPPVARTPQQALRRFTTMFINWRFAQLPQVKRRLAAQATGPLALQLTVEAQQALTEVSRRASNQANEGTVQLIGDPKHDGQYVVVTRETARLGDAHAQSGYFVYLAKLRSDGSRWRVSAFKAVN